MDSSGVLLGGSGTQYCFQFSFFNNANVGSGSKLWPSGATSTMSVEVKNGVFNVGIGDVSAGGDTLDFNFEDTDTVYLNVDVAVKVGPTCAPGDGAEVFETLSPRQRIYSSGFAINASTLQGYSAAQIFASAFSTTSADFFASQRNFFSTTSADWWKVSNNFFSTTSADYYLSQNQGAAFSTTSAGYLLTSYDKGFFFSTTSADYWKSANNFFSTTSSDYWKTATNFFSTSSADYFASERNFFSTTSASYFANSSSTVVKTYTANSFTATQTFTNASTTNISASYASSTQGFFGTLSIGSLNGILKAVAGAVTSAFVNLASDVTGILPVANGGTGWASLATGAVLYGNGSGAVATTSAGLPGQVLALLNGVPMWTASTTYSNGLVYSNGNVTLDTSGNWSGTLAGYSASQLIALGFSTTSADFWTSQRNFFATSSVDYWKTQNNFFSTTSADYLASERNFFSTTSADYLTSQRSFFSTTSASYFADSSTTIPKTYTANSFTAKQTFTNASTTNITATYASSTQAFFGSLTLGNLSGVLRAASGAVSNGLVDLGSEVTGVLGVGHGGTGWASLAAGAVLYGNGSGAVATTTVGLPGQVLALLNGVPTWAASTTFSNGLTYSNGNVTLDTTGNWSGTLSGYSAPQILAQAFATTSADYFITERNFFSTTSAAYWKTQNDFFSTTSVNYWKSVTDLFSTTSDAYFLSQNQGAAFSTTSAVYFAGSSTTIPKTYTNNTFTGNNIFSGTLTFGSLNGPLDVRNGLVGATSSIGAIYGGTGQTSYTPGDILYANSPTSLARIASTTSGTVLALLNGIPTWTATSTLSNISGTLGVGSGGTGQSSLPSGQLLYGSGTAGVQSVATSTVSNGTGISVTGTGAVVGSGLTINFAAPAGAALSIPYASTTAITSTNASTSNIVVSGITNALHLGGANGAVSAYGGSGACTNQFVRSLNGAGAATCNTVQNTDLANSSLTVSAGSGLSGGGAVSLGSSVSLSLNLANANIWTGLQQFGASASSTQFSSTVGYFGGTATTTFDASGNVTFGNSAARIILQNNVDQALNFATSSSNVPALTISTRASANGLVGIGTTTPWGKFSVEMGPVNPALVVSNQGSSSPALYIGGINQNGLVGIGTSSPFAQFAVDTSNLAGRAALSVGSVNSTYFLVNNGGHVGIGTASPNSAYALDVNGDVNVGSNNCFRVGGVCIGYTIKLASVYATSSPGTTTIAFTGAQNAVPSFTPGVSQPAAGTLVLPSNTSYTVIEAWGGGGAGGGTAGTSFAGGNSSIFGYATSTGGSPGANNANGALGGLAGSGSISAAFSALGITSSTTLTGQSGNTQTANNTGQPGGSAPRGGGGGRSGVGGGAFGGGGGGATAGGAGGGGAGYVMVQASQALTNLTNKQLGVGAGGTAGTGGGAGGAGGIVVTVYATSSPSAFGNDYAELFPVSSPEINAGDIVAVDTGVPVSMKPALRGDAAPLAGVISTEPGQTLGDPTATGMRPVALSGRVPVKISHENGDVKIGDRITLSSTPGVGMRATIFDNSVGIVIDKVVHHENGPDTVMIFLDLEQGIDINTIAFSLLGPETSLTDASSTQSGPLDFVGGMMQAIGKRLFTSSNSEAATSTIATSTAESASSTPSVTDGFAKSLLDSIIGAITHLLADAGNGIGSIFANTFHAKEKICVDDQCMSRSDMKALLKMAHSSQTASGGVGASGAGAPVLEIQGNNPATINVGDTYNDLGAIITSPADDVNLGITYLVDGLAASAVMIDTSFPAEHTVTYRAIDSAGNVGEATRTIRVVSLISSSEASSTAQSSTGSEESSSTPPTVDPEVTTTSGTSTPTTP